MKKILVLAMLTCCGFINSIFAGDNIEEIESALKNNLLRRNIQNLKSSPNEVSYKAYGNDLGKTFSSGSIDLYFDLPSGLVGDLTLKINAYDVDYPSATEKDLVYFNDKKIGRLEGRNGTYVVDTFKVPASYIESGQNKLRIDVNVSNEGWVTAVSEAVLIGSAFTLKASDGTHPYGVKLEWTNIGADKYEIWRSEHSLFDYSPKKIVEVSSRNTYIDENTEVGAVYDYYIKVGEQTSTEDTGFSGKKSVIPIITNVETSKIWLEHSGGMKQVRITWNDFSRKLYSVRDLVFVLENSTKPFYIHHMPNISYDSSKGTYYTELSLDSCILDTHGKLKVNLFWEYRDTSKDFTTSCPVSQTFDVNVFYDKYGIQDNIPNWFRYWHDDQAIKDADQYLAVELIGTKNQLDGRFRYNPLAGISLGAAQIFNSSFKAVFDINGFPKTYIIKKHDVVFSLGPLGAAKKKSFEISNNGVTKIVGSPSLGLETTAQVIKHELKHLETFKESFPIGCLQIGKFKENYSTKFKTFSDYTNQLANANTDKKFKIFDYIEKGKFAVDLDGDGVNDEREDNGYLEWDFSSTNPDTWSVHTKNQNFSSYATYGDNEVLARDAEKDGLNLVVKENDWAFPGENIVPEYKGLSSEQWDECKKDVINSLAIFPQISYNLSTRTPQVLKGEDTSSEENAIFCLSKETDELPEFIEIEEQNSMSIIGPVNPTLLSNESGLFTNLVFNLTITTSSDIDELGRLEGWLVDDNDNPIALAETHFTILPNNSIIIPLKFDGNIIHKSGGKGFTLKYVSLTRFSEISSEQLQMLKDVASLDREYSYEEFTGDILFIDKDGIGETFSEEGLAFNIPFTSAVNDDLCKIKLSLCDTNGTYIASETKEVSCVEGTNLVPVLFDAQTLYCSNISGPYKVQFVEVELSSGEKQRVWYAYISNEYSYKDFRSDSAVIDIDTSSVNIFAREAGSVSGYDAIVCNFNVSNSLDHAVSYTCEMILRNTNGTLVASSSDVKRFEQGNNDISLYFSGDDIIESQIDGPYVVSEITLEPLDEIGIKERFLPEHEAIDLTISDFRTRSFFLKSIPEYNGKLEENLSINVVVERPTEITATALLIDGLGEYVTTATSTITAPSIGDYTLELAFNVAEIRASGHPGPYKISYLRLKSNIEGEKDLLIDEFEVSDIILWDYVLENGGAKICDGDSTLAMLNSTSGSLVIPSTIDGYPVTAIGDNAFSFFNNLTSVIIPDTVTSIGAEAFYGCSGITNLFIPNSVKSIGSRAFSSCSSLTTLIAGQYVCANRISNIFPDAYLTIKNIEILDGVTTIGNYAFQNCSSLTNLIIPNSVTSIGSSAFYNCRGLTSVTIPNSVTSIGDNAFRGCSGLTKFIVDLNNLNYKSINGLLLTKDGKTLIAGVNGNVVIPQGVTSIGDYAFYNCRGLTSVTIPNSVTSIGSSAFSFCSGLTKFIVDSNNPIYKSVNGLLLTKDGETLIAGINGNVVIPQGVTSIGDSVFFGCSGLTSITIPDSVTHIGDYAFEHCSGLTSITIPDSVTSIGRSAFYNCSGLTSITIPDGVTSIGYHAFRGCSGLTSVTIPDSVTSIGDYAFEYCSGLTSITIPDSVTSIGYDAFFGCNEALYDLSTIPGVKLVDGWVVGYTEECPSELHITGVSGVAAGAFQECSGLTSVTIPDGVTSIGDYAFYYCSGLTSITIPDSVTSIGDYAFSSCWCLTSITIPNSVTNIGDSAFYYCSSLTSITIPDSVTSIGDYAFQGCECLMSFTIGNGVTTIGRSVFEGCWGLTEFIVDSNNPNYKSVNGLLLSKDGKTLIAGINCNVVIPDSVTSIGYGAFSGCISLTSVTIPDSVTSIGKYAFWACSGLTSVTIPNSVTSIGDDAFGHCYDLKSAIFLGDAPGNVGNGIFSNCADDFTIKVKKGTKGWNGDPNSTELPETWYGYPIVYATEDEVLGIMTELVDGIEWKYRVVNGEAKIYGGIRNSAIPEESTGAITIPSMLGGYSVTSIGDYVFYNCSGLTSITIPNNVMSIGYQAFYYCNGLTSISIPNSVTNIVSSAFDGCSGLKSFSVSPNNPSYKSVNGLLLSKDGKTLIAGINGDVVIPDSVTCIGSDSFWGCSGLTSITIPDSVTSIGNYTFDGCSGLTSITIPNNVTNIGYEAFQDCIGLTRLIIPDSVTSIGVSAFSGCYNLTSITIPDSVTSIGGRAFASCYRLKEIINKSSLTIDPQSNSYGLIAKYNIDVHHGESKIVNYNNFLFYSDGRKHFLLSYIGTNSNISLPNDFNGEKYELNHDAFYKCINLENVIISAGVTNIGECAFQYCSNLGKVIFLGDSPNMDVRVFQWCDKLVIKVKRGTKGWNGDSNSTELPETWCGYPIEYATEDDLYLELDANATAEDVANALSGSVDENLAKNITSVEMYSKYKAWASVVKAPIGEEATGVEIVMDSPTAWMSFALDQSKLIANDPVEGDVTIASLDAVAADGSFEFTVNINQIDVGDGAVEENLKKLFKIEGATTLGNDANFSSENIEIELAEPVNGNVKFKILPKDSPDSFFIRAKLLK